MKRIEYNLLAAIVLLSVLSSGGFIYSWCAYKSYPEWLKEILRDERSVEMLNHAPTYLSPAEASPAA